MSKIFEDRAAHLGRLDHEADAPAPAERAVIQEPSKLVSPQRRQGNERMPAHLQAHRFTR